MEDLKRKETEYQEEERNRLFGIRRKTEKQSKGDGWNGKASNDDDLSIR